MSLIGVQDCRDELLHLKAFPYRRPLMEMAVADMEWHDCVYYHVLLQVHGRPSVPLKVPTSAAPLPERILTSVQVPGPACPASFEGLLSEAPTGPDGLYTYTCAAPGEVSMPQTYLRNM